ncbi:MAG: OmpA family protein [Gemmatimonadota bacterium]|nr:OmpA family protein [Gemmatimonadota bacterium]
MSNYMQLSFTAMKVLLLHLALLILLVLDSHAQLNLDAIGRAVDDLEKARGQQAELFSPKSFAQANKEYERYVQLLREGKSEREIQAVLARFRAAINITMDHIVQVHTILVELLRLRDKAHTLNAPIIVPKEFKEAETRFRKTIEKLEDDKLSEAESLSSAAETYYRGAIISASKIAILGSVRANLAKIRDLDGHEYVPQTYQNIQSLIAEVSSSLERGEALTPELIAKSEEAQSEAQHALYLLDLIGLIRENKSSWESLILENERNMYRVGVITGRPFAYDTNVDGLFEGTLHDIKSRQDSLKALIRQGEIDRNVLGGRIDSLRTAIAKQQIRLASTLERYQTDLQSRKEDLERRRRELNADLTQQTILDAANQAQTRFDRKEALVFREGNVIRIRLAGLIFDSGKTTIPSKAYPLLDKMGQYLSLYQNINIVIEGHTDATGKEDKNLSYSEARANSVRDYLLRLGNVSEDNIAATGLGSSLPVASNNTRSGRAQNRRIVVIVAFDLVGMILK